MTVGGVPEALDVTPEGPTEYERLAVDLAEEIYRMQFAQSAMRDYQLGQKFDEGFEAGVLAAENGVGRA